MTFMGTSGHAMITTVTGIQMDGRTFLEVA